VSHRVGSLRQWIRTRPESRIAIVGHSNFFLEFTGLAEKLKNCEIYKMHI